MKRKTNLVIAFLVYFLTLTIHNCKKDAEIVNAPKVESVKLRKDSLKGQNHEMHSEIEDTLTMPAHHQ